MSSTSHLPLPCCSRDCVRNLYQYWWVTLDTSLSVGRLWQTDQVHALQTTLVSFGISRLVARGRFWRRFHVGKGIGKQPHIARVSSLHSSHTQQEMLRCFCQRAVHCTFGSCTTRAAPTMHSTAVLDRLSRPSYACTGAIKCLQPVCSCAKCNEHGGKRRSTID